MNIIFEGPDNTGKGTQIRLLNRYITENGNIPFHVLHYSGIKNKDPEKIQKLSSNYYAQMFDILETSGKDFILDRSHIGEAVYSPLYRRYSGDYVFELEKEFDDVLKTCVLFLFIDTPENLIKRDDGLSFSTQVEMKQKEVDLFKQAFQKTNISNKHLIDCSNGIDKVHETIISIVG